MRTHRELGNLPKTDVRVVDLQHVDGSLLRLLELVHTNNDLLLRVDASLLFGGALFDPAVSTCTSVLP